jgi:predicted DNA-binding transcriptional regulator AlpA
MPVELKASRRSRAAILRTKAAPTEHPTAPPECNQAESSGAPPTHSNQDVLLTDFDLEKLTGKARSSWQKARLTGDGPPFIRLGRLVRYRRSEFNAWLAACPSLRSTSEAA